MCERTISPPQRRDLIKLGNLLSRLLWLAVSHFQVDTIGLLLDNSADVRTNQLRSLPDWETEAYHSASMTPTMHVENMIPERRLPLDLPPSSSVKILVERERRIGEQTLNPRFSEPVDHFAGLSS